MAENWNQLVDDLIPFGVAQLCFFDAEKIRFLAEDETSSVALGEAIKALLGLDLAERLVSDTTVLEGRIAKRVRKSDELQALAGLEETWREKKEVVERLKQDLAGGVPQLERATSRSYKAEADFAKVGGKHWEQREQRQRQKGELEKTVEYCEESLVNLAGGALPLALVGDLLGQMAEQAQLERTSAESDFLTSLLTKRDKELLKQQRNRIENDLKPAAFEIAELEKQITKLNQQHISEKMQSDQNARIGALVTKTQETMKAFLKRATEKKIARLSDLVTTSFRYLLHKQQLVERVIIDPADFSITLMDQSGNVLPKDRLSEGEKQIFAISVLWGLSQASARPLPAIIDTPMGRLDSEHRNQLVERYFPHASHQVIILSTDTEIEENYFEQLKPSLARAYHLNYDEAGRMTTAEEGYFW